MLASKQKIGIEIKNLRQQLGFTQKELSEKLDVTTIHLSYIENGIRIPSKSLMAKIYSLNGVKEIPEPIKKLIKDAKKETKVESNTIKPSNTVYELKDQGLYSQTKLEKLLRKDPENIIYIIGLYNILKEKGKSSEADEIILTSLSKIKDDIDRKWLEAYHFQLGRNEKSYKRAIELMEEALQIFDNKYISLDEKLKEKKSELLFRFSLIYFDYGQYLFLNISEINEVELNKSIEQFYKSVEMHNKLRQVYIYPFSQLDYANIHYWLGLLHLYLRIYKEENNSDYEEIQKYKDKEKEYWKKFVFESREAIFYNYRESIKEFPFKGVKQFYSESYMVINYSFLALGYIRLALLESNKELKEEYVKQGELILAENTPIKVNNNHTAYRYYFNFANFYSIKAEILEGFSFSGESSAVNQALDFCFKGLYEAYGNNKNAFLSEIKEPEEMKFYKIKKEEELNRLLKR